MKFLGHRLGLRKRPHRGERACLRPQAEFARASGRGLRRVKNFIKNAKGTCKKTQDPEHPEGFVNYFTLYFP